MRGAGQGTMPHWPGRASRAVPIQRLGESPAPRFFVPASPDPAPRAAVRAPVPSPTSSSAMPTLLARLPVRSLRAGAVPAATPLALAGLALAVGLAAARPGTAANAAPAVDIPKAAVGSYDIDAVHSSVGYKIKHLDVAYHLGRFDKFSGEVVLGATAAESSVRITVDTESVSSGHPDRDKHLRNQDFFDVKQFPEATFTSTKVAAKDADTFTVSGTLALHGVEKPVTFDMDFVGAKDAGERNGYKSGFFGELAIQRRDFGMDTYPDDVLGNEVVLTFAIECNKRK